MKFELLIESKLIVVYYLGHVRVTSSNWKRDYRVRRAAKINFVLASEEWF